MKRSLLVALIWALTFAGVVLGAGAVLFGLMAASQYFVGRTQSVPQPISLPSNAPMYLAVAVVLVFIATFGVKLVGQRQFSVRGSKQPQVPSVDSYVTCRCGARNHALALWCSRCSRLLIRVGRPSTFVLMVAVLGSLVLFRADGSIWVLYLLITLGLIHLYAIGFSRGEALGSAATAFSIVVLAWGLWTVFGSLGAHSGTISGSQFIDRIYSWRASVGPRLPLASILVWGLGVGLSLALGGRVALPGVRLAGSYFLATGAFVLGLWGSWAVLIENRRILDSLYNFVIVIALVAPLLLLVVLLERQPPAPPEAGQRPYVAAIWLFVATAYLLSAQVLTNLVDFVLITFLPRLIGHNPIVGLSQPWLLTILEWNVFLAGLAATLGLVFVVTSSVVQVAATYQYQQSSASPQGIRPQGQEPGRGVDIHHLLYNAAAYTRALLSAVARNLRATIEQLFTYAKDLLQYLVVPVLAFSALAALMILVLSHYQSYVARLGSIPPHQLWGEALTVGILALVLCRACFGLAPPRTRRALFEITTTVIYVGIAFYLAFSLSALAEPLLWATFRSIGVEASSIEPGPIFLMNAAALLLLAAGTFLLWQLAGRRVNGEGQAPSTAMNFGIGRLESYQGAPFVILAVIAALLGIPPLLYGVRSALGW